MRRGRRLRVPLLRGVRAHREHGLTPADTEIALGLPEGFAPLLSDKDAAAPTLAQALEQGLLPSYEDAQTYRQSLA